MSGGATLRSDGAYNYIPTTSLNRGLTTGWSLGNVSLSSTKLPSGVPTFGSGASVNLSLSATSTNPLASVYSYKYDSSAATTAGDFMASDALSLRIADQAQVLQFKFYYQANTNGSNGNFSGTSSNSFGVAIYDVTNSAWIIPAGVFNLVQNSGVGECSGTFQTPINMTSFRIVIYNANATSGAITMYFDDFFVGPQITAAGAAVSDSTAYTMTTDGFGTTTQNLVHWQRIGDRMLIQGYFKSGTITATPGAFYLPSGYSIDYSKLTTTTNVQKVGEVSRVNTSGTPTSTSIFTLFADGTTTNKVFWTNDDAASNQYVARNVNDISATNDGITFNFNVPIAGWSSNTVMSNDTDTRVVAASMQTSSTTLISGVDTKVVFSTVDFDSHGAINGAKDTFTVPVSGIYRVSAQLFGPSVAHTITHDFRIVVYKNGVSYRIIESDGQAASTGTYRQTSAGSTLVQCNTGDTLQIYGNTDDGGALASTAGLCWANFERLSGPAVIAASESVAAEYTTLNSFSALDSTNTQFYYTTKKYDTHNAYNTTTGAYIAPISGKYSFTMQLQWSTSPTGTKFMLMYVNGVSTGIQFKATNVADQFLTGSIDYALNAGDSVTFECFQNSGGTVTNGSNAGYQFICIKRIGN